MNKPQYIDIMATLDTFGQQTDIFMCMCDASIFERSTSFIFTLFTLYRGSIRLSLSFSAAAFCLLWPQNGIKLDRPGLPKQISNTIVGYGMHIVGLIQVTYLVKCLVSDNRQQR
jgi:hypothetical protein